MGKREIVSEKLLEKKACDAVKNVGGLAVKLIAVNLTGLPDRLMLWRKAQMCFLEFKTTGKSLSPRQELMRDILVKLGFRYEVFDSNETLNAFIAEL